MSGSPCSGARSWPRVGTVPCRGSSGHRRVCAAATIAAEPSVVGLLVRAPSRRVAGRAASPCAPRLLRPRSPSTLRPPPDSSSAPGCSTPASAGRTFACAAPPLAGSRVRLCRVPHPPLAGSCVHPRSSATVAISLARVRPLLAVPRPLRHRPHLAGSAPLLRPAAPRTTVPAAPPAPPPSPIAITAPAPSPAGSRALVDPAPVRDLIQSERHARRGYAGQ